MFTLKVAPVLKIKIIDTSIRTVSIASHPVSVTKNHRVEPWKNIPGPSTLPLIGQLHHFLPGGSLYNVERYNICKELHNNYGPIVRLELMFAPPTAFIVDPESIAYLLRAENVLPNRPGLETIGYYRKNSKKSAEQTMETPLTGFGCAQGEEWKRFRSAVAPLMLNPDNIERHRQQIDEIAHQTVLRLKDLRGENNMVPSIIEELKLWSMEVNGFVALGRRIWLNTNSQDNSLGNQLMNQVTKYFMLAAKLHLSPSLWKYFPTKNFREAMNALKEIEKITDHYIQRAKDDLKSINKTGEEKSLLQQMLEIDEEVAIVTAGDLLSAGLDNVHHAVLGLMYLLAINPEQQQKLREKMKTDERRSYMKAFIKEAMRILPTSSVNFRRTSKEYTVLGYQIPKDTFVVFNHLYLSTSENQFHRAKEFLPERWLVGKEDPLYFGNAHPFSYLPFGFGGRICLGRRIAQMQMETLLGHLMENFMLEWDGPPPKIELLLTNTIYARNFVFKDLHPSSEAN